MARSKLPQRLAASKPLEVPEIPEIPDFVTKCGLGVARALHAMEFLDFLKLFTLQTDLQTKPLRDLFASLLKGFLNGLLVVLLKEACLQACWLACLKAA